MAKVRANNASGCGGGAYYAEGTVNLSTSADTPIITTDVNTGVAFQPKTIICNTKQTGKSYYVAITYDADDTNLAGSGKFTLVANGSTTLQYYSLSTPPRNGYGDLVSVNANGFTCDSAEAAGGQYGQVCNYKAWG